MLVEETGMAPLPRPGVAPGGGGPHPQPRGQPRLRCLEVLIRQVLGWHAGDRPALADVLPCHGINSSYASKVNASASQALSTNVAATYSVLLMSTGAKETLSMGAYWTGACSLSNLIALSNASITGFTHSLRLRTPYFCTPGAKSRCMLMTNFCWRSPGDRMISTPSSSMFTKQGNCATSPGGSSYAFIAFSPVGGVMASCKATILSKIPGRSPAISSWPFS